MKLQAYNPSPIAHNAGLRTMSLQLLSTIDSFAGAELATTPNLRYLGARPGGQCGQSIPRKISMAALPKWRLTRVLTYIEANIGERIRLADLAATAGLSRMYFAKQFRATTGLRPHDFVLRKRIERAQRMLAETPDTLVDIALSVGFQTQAHFTTVFKKIAGHTPYQFRREQPRVA